MEPTRTNALLPQAGRLTLAALLLLGLAAAPAVHAQGYTIKTLMTFSGANRRYLYGGLTLSNGILYGTTEKGGANGYGEIFSVPTTSGAPTILASFDQANSAGPTGGLIYSGGIFYGSTISGGGGDLNGLGSIFAIIPNGAPVPEASSLISFGLLLVGGLGGLVLRRRRRTAAA